MRCETRWRIRGEAGAEEEEERWKGKRDRRGAELGPSRKARVQSTDGAWRGVKKCPEDGWHGKQESHQRAYWEQPHDRKEPPGKPTSLGKCRELKRKAEEEAEGGRIAAACEEEGEQYQVRRG